MLIDQAGDRGATCVVAHTLATRNAATAVRCGFTRTATHPDPDGGVDEVGPVDEDLGELLIGELGT
jgi:hypothetical protein